MMNLILCYRYNLQLYNLSLESALKTSINDRIFSMILG